MNADETGNDSNFDIDRSDEPLETLAHRLWVHWSMNIAEEEDISDERLQRWDECWVPYEDLDAPTKDVDRRLVEKYTEEEPDYEG